MEFRDSKLTLERAQSIIRSHGHNTAIVKGKLRAEMGFTFRDDSGTVHSGSDWVDVQLTKKWVYTWLGY